VTKLPPPSKDMQTFRKSNGSFELAIVFLILAILLGIYAWQGVL
jgi:hypothetical protein